MKITCTKEEKVNIIDVLMNSQFCCHPDDNESCIYDNGCYNCIEDSIKWEIENGEHIEENKNECFREHNDYCEFVGKPCNKVDHEICEALIKAYDKGYENAYG